METRIETTIQAIDGNKRTGLYRIVAHIIGADGFSDPTMKDRSVLVVMADDERNEAFSITNNAERVATAVLQQELFPAAIINPARVIWAEHYPDRAFIGSRPQFEENFAFITFHWDLGVSSKTGSSWIGSRPVWSHVTRATLEGMIKQPFEISGVKV